MQRGISILETIVYIAIFVVVIVLVINIILSMTALLGKARAVRNVNEQGTIAMERILRELRLADNVDTSISVLGSSPGDLTLNTIVSPSNTTATTRRFFLDAETVKLEESALTTLLTAGVRVTNLTFHLLFETATAYFVRGSFGGCSDTAAGTTKATAFCTISKAASVAVAGDVIFVGEGTYTETVTPANSGAAGNPIVYFADRDGHYTDDAGTILLDGQNTQCAAFDLSAGRNYLVLDGFTATRYESSGCSSSIGAFFLFNANNNIYRNLVVYNTERDAFAIRGSNNLLENCLGYDLGDDGIDGIGFSENNNIIRNCTFTEDLGRNTGGAGYALELGDGNGTNIFENNIIDGDIGLASNDWQNQIWNYNDWPQGSLPGSGAGTGNISANPLFVDEISNNYRLQQIAAGEASDSPALDAGSPFVPADAMLSLGTTRSDNIPDSDRMDMGYHYPSPLADPFFLTLDTPAAQTVRVEITLESGAGQRRAEETFYGTVILRGNY